MTREEAINEIKSWDFLEGKEIEAIHTLIPELRESEDERIIKTLKEYVKNRNWMLNGPTQDEVLTWLEKQKESLHIPETCKENTDSFTDEDERIRKELIEFIQWSEDRGMTRHDFHQAKRPLEWIAYLEKQKDAFENGRQLGIMQEQARQELEWPDEKQKENIEKEYVFRPLAGTDITIATEQAIRRVIEGDHLVLAFNGWYVPVDKHATIKGLVDSYDTFIEKQKEQKPAEWSEEDEKIVNNIVSALGQYIDYRVVSGTGSGYATPRYAKEIDWLKSLPLNLKKKNEDVAKLCSNEWSEEDEKWLKLAIQSCEMCGNPVTASWLKSLRPSWKPSKEQMVGLSEAVSTFDGYEESDAIKSLYNDLKKLM